MSTPYRAVILDLDGVITRTAVLHARAWKQMFDAFLADRAPAAGETVTPFDIVDDYLAYVDGKPRYDGVRSFLASRGIELPEAAVRDLGNRKDELFHTLLEQTGVEVYDDAVAQIRIWRQRGLKTAVITSSRNGTDILEIAGLRQLFDAKIDGNDAADLGIPGKPAPDIFLRAAEQIDVAPADTIVVEDAIAGVQAGRAGGFGLVVGVNRNGAHALVEHGADIVVSDLREIDRHISAQSSPRHAQHPAPDTAPDTAPNTVPNTAPNTAPESAIESFPTFTERLRESRLALFLDYDGTLTPIVPRPEDATLTDDMRRLIRQLAEHVTVGIISGRDLDDVRGMVQLDDLYYAGSHGFDVRGPGGMRMQHEAAVQLLPELDAAAQELNAALDDIDGVRVERKRFALAVHYREAADTDIDSIEERVDAVHSDHPRLRRKGGKKIFELQPDVPWHKGYAVRWLLEQVEPGRDVLPVYIGDDVTDEDAFDALAGTGIGIRVGEPDEPTRAQLLIRDTDELARFLILLLDWLNGKDDHG